MVGRPSVCCAARSNSRRNRRGIGAPRTLNPAADYGGKAHVIHRATAALGAGVVPQPLLLLARVLNRHPEEPAHFHPAILGLIGVGWVSLVTIGVLGILGVE